MLYLFEITYTDKESTATYNDFADELALSAEFDVKLGAAMKSSSYKGEILIAFDEKGKIYDSAFHYKDGVEAPISDRLFTAKNVNGELIHSHKACNSLVEMQGEAYSQRGAAKKNKDVLSILCLGITSGAIVVNQYWEREVEEPKPTPEEPQE